jgi:tetratricopeptide (TPR) repeat protein
MNETKELTKELNSLPALAGVNNERERALKRPSIAVVRVSPGPYLAVACVVTFFAALLLRAQYDAPALLLISSAWFLLPLLALTDRIVFDGVSLRRQGLPASFLHLLFGYRKQLAIEDFETVETQAVRTLRRGGSVRYRYRTQISGKGNQFVIISAGRDYRKMVRELFPLIHENKLDGRTRDLRDYLNDPRFLQRKAQLSQLASSDILEVSTPEFRLGGKAKRRSREAEPTSRPQTSGPQFSATPEDIERAHVLRRLGNELRVSGRLREAGEAFRRALNVRPYGAWLIYDFARLLRSQASAQTDARLLSRARAALRLASIRAKNDLVLLPLIGESFLECGDARQARQALQKVVELDSGNFKARVGLADISLREGKLAHVIHHYQEAARVSSEQALAHYARSEGEYYMQLNNDDDYLAAELRRISWLQTVTRVRRLALRVTNFSVLLALLGGFLDPVAAGVGWSFASSALIMWLLTVGATKMLFARSKPRSVDLY